MFKYFNCSSIQVRYNVKVNVLPYTSIFAFAAGFRANWDIKPPKLVSHNRRITQENYVPYNPPQYEYQSQYPYQSRYQNSQYQNWYQPASSYQRSVHSAVQRAFDWHGLNGFACLQRTICEVSMLHHDDVISQMFRIVFK
ncbi:uncharacterized protein LOC124366510 [Homalodisca vitripennis]|uniref:uncharacterized protein LOC124366510 n=1 Tax=Homalodisca vitripennis TaxID=197043 RepID=UPI001EEBEB82|nr:uncharacterized protein LOC124366510 [Homalodisca vitripennis]